MVEGAKASTVAKARLVDGLCLLGVIGVARYRSGSASLQSSLEAKPSPSASTPSAWVSTRESVGSSVSC